MIGSEVTAFFEGGSALIVGTVGPDGAPYATRGWGLDVLADSESVATVRVLIDADDTITLEHLAAGNAVAITGADVPTLRSTQIKGRARSIEPRDPGDRARAARFVRAFFTDVAATDGTSWELMERLVPSDYVACVVEVDVVYNQTPGPTGRDRRGRTVSSSTPDRYTLDDLRLCFEGAVPAAIVTASGDGTPNITYLSRVLAVDDERVALSNQFFSKTSRNLADNPRASVLVIAPTTYDQFRLTLVYERTERRGPIFERLRDDVDAIVAIEGMQDVFKLRTADIYRVLDIELMVPEVHRQASGRPGAAADRRTPVATSALAELIGRLSRASDLDTMLSATTDGLAHVLGHGHSLLLLLDETGERLYTIASHGYEAEAMGSEVVLGEGVVGMAAARCAPMRVGNLRQMTKYSRIVRQAFEDPDSVGPGCELPLPALPEVQSRLAVPAMAGGQLVGVLTVESDDPVAFDEEDEAALSVVASVVANAIEADRAWASVEDDTAARVRSGPSATPLVAGTHVKFFAVDGSTFLGGEYLIKGVAGRILWSLLRQFDDEGKTEFTNREVRLDPTLDLPQFRDNLESRLILLKRRLDERGAPIRLEKTGRGRFRLEVDTELRLDEVAPPAD